MSTSILLIYTGGTIGMVQDPTSGTLKPVDFEQLRSSIPELNSFNYKIDTYSFETPVDSSNATPDTWLTLARIIEDKQNDYDGFVLLHGSDTMAFTSSALSFLLQGLGKPVILTGSQLPIGVIRTDGKENLITAIEIAAAQHNGKPVVPEVAVYFDYQLMRGNRTTKVSASHFDAFESPNYPVLAQAGIDLKFDYSAILDVNPSPVEVQRTLCRDIGSIRLFPGIMPSYVEPVLSSSTLKAVVVETFGSGNIPMLGWLEKLIAEAVSRGVNVINVSQCLRGEVKQGSYETSSFLANAGVISGADMTFEAAITKSMCLLGQSEDNFEQRFVSSICGERG